MLRILTLAAAVLLASTPVGAEPVCGDVNADGVVNTADALVIARGEALKCPAPPPPRFQLLGFTEATFQGNAGILELNRACAAEFLQGRICTTDEVFETRPLPSGLTGVAWVRPVFDPSGVDVNGRSAAAIGSMTCGGWTTNSSGGSGSVVVIDSGVMGSTLTDYTGFLVERCDQAVPVACCVLVP